MRPVGDPAVVGNHDDRELAFAVEVAQELEDRSSGAGIQSPGRFVGEQQFWLTDARSSDRHALLLPTRQLIGLVVHPIGEVDPSEHLFGARSALRPGDPRVLQREHHVFDGRHIAEQMKALKYEAEIGQSRPRLLGAVELGHVGFGEMIGARRRTIEAPDDVEQRRFATPGGPAQRDDFPGLNVEIELVQNGDFGVAGPVRLRQSADRHQRGRGALVVRHGGRVVRPGRLASCRSQKRPSSLREGWTTQVRPTEREEVVPSVAHFIWYGPRFWWVNALAIRSATAKGDFDRIVLHHDQDLSDEPAFAALSALPTFEARRLVPEAIFGRIPSLGPALSALHAQLDKPNARANMVRAAILATEGGVYLDTDTITIGSLTALRAAPAFCGQERVVLPVAVLRDRRATRIAKSWALMALRDGARRWPDGWRWFRKVEDWFPLAVNNAVLGAAPDHPLIMSLLEGMVALPAERRLVPYALGTHLLQDRVAAYAGDDLVVHPPSVFFPLGPEVSQHWFRLRSGSTLPLDEVVYPDTKVVHWYASVRTKRLVPNIDPAYVRAHADRQMFSALAAPFVGADA